MTPELSWLKKQAEEFEVPFEVLKGFMFVNAWVLLFAADEGQAQGSRQVMWMMSDHLPEGAVGVGERYDADRLRKILSSVDLVPVSEKERAAIVHELYQAIGECLDEDLEGSFAAGIRFGEDCEKRDARTAYGLASQSFLLQSGHLAWLTSVLRRASKHRWRNPVPERAMQALVSIIQAPGFGFAQQLCQRLSSIHYVQDQKAFWTGPREEFVKVAVEQAVLMFSQEWLSAPSGLEKWVHSKAVSGSSVSQAIEQVAASVEEAFGFLTGDSESDLYYGERLDRRGFDLFAVATMAMSTPNWVPEAVPIILPMPKVLPTVTMRSLEIEMEALEIPFDIQKGVAFVEAIFLLSSGDNDEALTRISQHFPNVSINRGDRAQEDLIWQILLDGTSRVFPNLTSEAFPRLAEPVLPPTTKAGLYFGVWIPFGLEFHRQLGAAIDDDLEGAFLAGYWFYKNHLLKDVEGLDRVLTSAMRYRPAHLNWIHAVLTHPDPDEILRINPAEAVLFAGSPPGSILSGLDWEVCQKLQTPESTRQRGEAWEKDPNTFMRLSITEARKMVSQPAVVSAELLQKVRETEAPSPKATIDDSVEAMKVFCKEVYGIDSSYDEKEHTLGRRLELRTTILRDAVKQAILAKDMSSAPKDMGTVGKKDSKQGWLSGLKWKGRR